MQPWYLLLASVLCAVFCCEAQNKGSDTKLQKGSLQKFFNLNNDLVTGKDSIGSDQSTINATSKSPEKKVPSLHSLPLRCKQHSTGSLGKKLCTKKHISSAVKKSFRPHYYDDDEDYDDPRDDYDETLDDEEIPEEDVTGSYRAFEDSPPRYDDDSSERFRDYESEDDHESWRGHEFEDEPLGRPGYEDDLDDESDRWDSEQPRRHHDRARWRSHHHRKDDDEYEPNYYPLYHHHPRLAHYHHHHQYGHPAVHTSYRTLNQAAPSWLPYPHGYQSVSSAPAQAPYISYPLGWTNSPAGLTSWQSPYLSTIASRSFSVVGPRVVNPYIQNTLTYPQRKSSSLFVPPSPRHISSPPYLEATARNLVSFTNTLPGIAATLPRLSRDSPATLPRLSNDIFHYLRVNPRIVSHTRHFGAQFPRPF